VRGTTARILAQDGRGISSAQHRGGDVERGGDRDHFGEPLADVVQVAREDPHVAAGAVYLDARAVDLPLDRRGAGGRERRGRVRRGRGQHRQHRASDLEREGGESRLAVGERDLCGAREVTGEHRRAAQRRPI
jgi:hypothetical protein